MKQIEQPFEELMIPRRELQNNSAMRYRVYRDTKSYKLVEAISALDALTRSGISKAYKIERYNPLSDNIVHLGQVEKLLSGENVADIDDVADVADVKANDVLPIKTEPEAIAEIVQPAPESTVPEQTPEQTLHTAQRALRKTQNGSVLLRGASSLQQPSHEASQEQLERTFTGVATTRRTFKGSITLGRLT